MRLDRMRILIVSYFSPPYNAIGAVRAGKTAKYLLAAGHDVRLLAAADQPLPATLPLEIPFERVSYARQLNINAPVDLLLGGRRRIVARGYSDAKGKSPWLARLGHLYKILFHVPDHQIGWYPDAVRQGQRLLEEWRPDVILASATPYTSLLVARTLAERAAIPWVAELRDLWTDNHYREFPEWRLRLERHLERWVLGSAAALVTVSTPLADVLRGQYQQPVAVIYNGFDPEDYPQPSERQDRRLTIVYTGSLYEGRRDITPLFSALQSLPRVSERVRLRLFGYGHGHTLRLASQYGLDGVVEDGGMVSYHESLQAQVDADLLLQVLVDDPRDKGVLTGKLFEYLGAGRPIICIGSREGEAAQLIEALGVGTVACSSAEIAELIERYSDRCFDTDLINRLSDTRRQFTRAHQADVLQQFLGSIVRGGHAAGD